jgi:hypothetical protein
VPFPILALLRGVAPRTKLILSNMCAPTTTPNPLSLYSDHLMVRYQKYYSSNDVFGFGAWVLVEGPRRVLSNPTRAHVMKFRIEGTNCG